MNSEILEIFIVGNSGAARECYWILRDIQSEASEGGSQYKFAGFLSFQNFPGNLKDLSALAIGDLEDHVINPEAGYVIGVGQPGLRKQIFNELKKRGASLINLVHPWTAICPSAKIGEGNIFQRGCTVYADAVIGNGNYINGAANLSHDARIGDFNFLAPYSIVLGGARIGSCNHLGPHSVVLDRARVGNGNLIAPSSAIYKGCGDGLRMSGNPAIKIGAIMPAQCAY